MLKVTEASPTAGLMLSWRDFIPQVLLRRPQKTLEQKIADFVGIDEVQIECSGTAALVVALEALKTISDKKYVVISAYTCPWVALAVIKANLIPVLADSKPGHFDFCENSLKSVVNNQSLAVVHTHLAGRVADVCRTIEIARGVGAFVIEDAAQSMGGQLNGRAVGTFGDVGFFSLGVGKGLTIFAGGVVMSNSPRIRQALRQAGKALAPNHFLESRRILELLAYYLLYRPVGMGLAFGQHLRRALKRGNLIEAVGDDCSFDFSVHQVGNWRKKVGAKAAERLPNYLALTRSLAKARLRRLNAIPNINVLADVGGGEGVWPFFIIRMPNEVLRDAVLSSLWDKGLGVGRLFIHALKDYGYLAPYFKNAQTPNAQQFASQTFIITNCIWLSEHDFAKICEVISEQVAHV